jgi:hypothetical protein
MDNGKYDITAVRAAGLSDAEARRRLAAVYRLIFQSQRKGQEQVVDGCLSGGDNEAQDHYERNR